MRELSLMVQTSSFITDFSFSKLTVCLPGVGNTYKILCHGVRNFILMFLYCEKVNLLEKSVKKLFKDEITGQVCLFLVNSDNLIPDK